MALKGRDALRSPLDQSQRQIRVDLRSPGQWPYPEATLVCYEIIGGAKPAYAYLFQNVNPAGRWYTMKVRDGDRILKVNEQDVTQLSHERVHSMITDEHEAFSCHIVWHPELYMELGGCGDPYQQGEPLALDMYEHLKDSLRYLFDRQPDDPQQLIHERLKKRADDTHEDNAYAFAQRQWSLLSVGLGDVNVEETMTNMLELAALFEHVGVGLNREEIYG